MSKLMCGWMPIVIWHLRSWTDVDWIGAFYFLFVCNSTWGSLKIVQTPTCRPTSNMYASKATLAVGLMRPTIPTMPD